MFNKIKSVFKKKKDMIPAKHETVEAECMKLLSRLLEEDEALIKKYNL